MDLTNKLSSSILLQRLCGSIMLNLFYENQTNFYTTCNSVGHSFCTCHGLDSCDVVNLQGKMKK